MPSPTPPRAAHQPKPPELKDLFERHRRRLLDALRRRLDPRLTPRIDPEDILQEAFLRASQHADPFRALPADQVFPWLYRLARECLLAAWRRENRECRDVTRGLPWPEASSVQLGLGLVSPATSPSSVAAREEMCQRVRDTLDLLKEQDREILWLRHFDQLTYPEAAAVLDIEVSAATLRYVRAIERLRKLWQELYPSDGGPP
jgi:RNA polymerase sigma-70 factor (ECF subfamily)